MSVIDVVKEVKNFSIAEKQEVWRELNEIVHEEPIELRLQRALFSDGLLNEIKMPFVPKGVSEEIPPIKIKGKPLSETIIEERR